MSLKLLLDWQSFTDLYLLMKFCWYWKNFFWTDGHWSTSAVRQLQLDE